MFNPIMSELVAREQSNDRLREADQFRMIKAATARDPEGRLSLRAAFGQFMDSVRYRFKALAHAKAEIH